MAVAPLEAPGRIEMAKQVVIDTDPGLDDALALVLALRSSALDVRAITTVAGNVPLESCTENALRVLEVLGASPAPPVYAGCAAPLSPPVARAEYVHGSDGVGGFAAKYPVQHLRPEKSPAADALVELARQNPNALTLIALGPLTNIAAACRRDPEVMAAVREVVVLGGSADGRGNATPHAEFNFYADPIAAQEVVQSGLHVTLVGLSVTESAPLSRQRYYERVDGMPPSTVRQFLADIAESFFDFCKRHRGVDACPLHDPLAVAATIEPSLIRTKAMPCYVDDSQGLTRGKLVAGAGREGTVVQVATEVNDAAFHELFLGTVCGS